MHSRLERLRCLEEEVERRYSARETLPPYVDHLGFWELIRLRDALIAKVMEGDNTRELEINRFLTLAEERFEQGWADKDALEKQDKDKKVAVKGFSSALGRRHGGYYCLDYRIDVLDLTEPEIKALTEVTEKATSVGDLESVAELVGRLRLDGKVMDMATFEALVLRGEIAAASRQPDCRTFSTRQRADGAIPIGDGNLLSTFRQVCRAA